MARKWILSGLTLPLLMAGACATGGEQTAARAAGGTAEARAELRDSAGRAVGTAVAIEANDGVRVSLTGTGLPQGAHGAHVHTTGACNPPGFESAGPHWNPTGDQHGKDNPAGMHKGDLPNLSVGTDGAGSISFLIAGVTLTGGKRPMLDADGAALVVHATADDYRTDPSGNSGGRIACGVLQAN